MHIAVLLTYIYSVFLCFQAVLTEYKLKAIEYVHGYFSSEQVFFYLFKQKLFFFLNSDVLISAFAYLPTGQVQNCFYFVALFIQELQKLSVLTENFT